MHAEQRRQMLLGLSDKNENEARRRDGEAATRPYRATPTFCAQMRVEFHLEAASSFERAARARPRFPIFFNPLPSQGALLSL
jgi:hypothetical protein